MRESWHNLVQGPRSKVRGPRSEVRGPRSRISELCEQTINVSWDLGPSTVFGNLTRRRDCITLSQSNTGGIYETNAGCGTDLFLCDVSNPGTRAHSGQGHNPIG